MNALRRVPVGWRWLALGVGVALAATLFWLFFLRGTGSGLPPAAQTPVAATPVATAAASIVFLVTINTVRSFQ